MEIHSQGCNFKGKNTELFTTDNPLNTSNSNIIGTEDDDIIISSGANTTILADRFDFTDINKKVA